MDQQIVQGVQHFDTNIFFSNQQSVAHEPDKFILDFKSALPQFSPENQPTMVINHRIMVLDPWGAKEFLRVLRENVERYEHKFGPIKKPEAIAKAEKEALSMAKQESTTSVRPSYMG